MPLTLVWGSPAVRAARSRRGIVDLIFGEREAPGRVRAMYTFFSDYKDSQVLVGEPLELPKFLAEEEGASDDVLARRLRWQLGGRIESEVRVVLGPPRKTVQRIQEEVLRSRRLVAEAKEIERAEKLTPQQIEKRARAALREIAADPKPWMFGFAQPIMSWVFRKIFDGIDVDVQGLEKVRAAARKGPLVIVPSHKSHIDYLVLSYVFLTHDLVPPLVAAGANLSFWPLGFFFRRGGAFFLRRTFKGDKLYGAVFRAYVRKMLRESFNIEFFIEGGRSRTGKLLAPKLGLLGMVVEAALDDDGAHARKAQLVPISIGYEKVIEEKSYAKEAAGGEKKKEDVEGSVEGDARARRAIWAAQHPVRRSAAARRDAARVRRARRVGRRGQRRRRRRGGAVEAGDAAPGASHRLRHRPRHRGDADGAGGVARCSPPASAASCGSELLAQARFLIERARANGGRLSAALVDDSGELDTEALDRAIELLARDGDLEVRSSGASGAFDIKSGRPMDEIYTVPEDRRPRLAYYRNNAIHLYVAEGLVALALLGASKRGLVSVEELRAAHAQAVAPAQARVQLSRRRDLRGDLRSDARRARSRRGLIAAATHGVHPAPGAAPRLALLAGQVDRLRRVVLRRRARPRVADRADVRQGSGAPHPRSRREDVLHRRGAPPRGVRARELRQRDRLFQGARPRRREGQEADARVRRRRAPHRSARSPTSFRPRPDRSNHRSASRAGATRAASECRLADASRGRRMSCRALRPITKFCGVVAVSCLSWTAHGAASTRGHDAAAAGEQLRDRRAAADGSAAAVSAPGGAGRRGPDAAAAAAADAAAGAAAAHHNIVFAPQEVSLTTGAGATNYFGTALNSSTDPSAPRGTRASPSARTRSSRSRPRTSARSNNVDMQAGAQHGRLDSQRCRRRLALSATDGRAAVRLRRRRLQPYGRDADARRDEQRGPAAGRRQSADGAGRRRAHRIHRPSRDGRLARYLPLHPRQRLDGDVDAQPAPMDRAGARRLRLLAITCDSSRAPRCDG